MNRKGGSGKDYNEENKGGSGQGYDEWILRFVRVTGQHVNDTGDSHDFVL